MVIFVRLWKIASSGENFKKLKEWNLKKIPEHRENGKNFSTMIILGSNIYNTSIYGKNFQKHLLHNFMKIFVLQLWVSFTGLKNWVKGLSVFNILSRSLRNHCDPATWQISKKSKLYLILKNLTKAPKNIFDMDMSRSWGSFFENAMFFMSSNDEGWLWMIFAFYVEMLT